MERAFVRMLALWLALWPFAAAATQNELVPPTSGIFTGVQYSQKIGDAFRSIASCNKGPTAPANVGGSTVDGLCWIDDSVSPWIKKRFVNGGWAVEGALDTSDSSFAGVVGGGLGSIASASGPVIDLGSVPQANVTITGTSPITGFGASAPVGVVKFIRFDDVLKLTNSSSLTVPGGFDLTTAAKDRGIATHLGSGNWEITQFTRANGIPIDVSAVGRIEFNVASLSAVHVLGWGQALTRTSYPAYLSKATRAQNGTRTSGNATITVTNTSGFGVGMPVESTGVNAGCTLSSWVTDTSITLNSAGCVTASGTSTVTVFLTGYGSGGSSTTVGAPDCTGRVMAGREATATRLTAAAGHFGSNSTSMMAANGADSTTLLATNLPPHVHGGTTGGESPLHAHTYDKVTSGVANYQTGSGAPSFVITPGQLTGTESIGHAHSFTTDNGPGASTAFSNVAPTLIAECVVRAIP